MKEPGKLIDQRRAEESLTVREALPKLINKEPLSDKEKHAIIIHPEALRNRLLQEMARRRNDVFLEAYLSAKANEEKAAIIKEWNRLRKAQ